MKNWVINLNRKWTNFNNKKINIKEQLEMYINLI